VYELVNKCAQSTVKGTDKDILFN